LPKKGKKFLPQHVSKAGEAGGKSLGSSKKTERIGGDLTKGGVEKSTGGLRHRSMEEEKRGKLIEKTVT